MLINSISRLMSHKKRLEKIKNNTFEKNLFGYTYYLEISKKEKNFILISDQQNTIKDFAEKKTSVYRPDLFR